MTKYIMRIDYEFEDSEVNEDEKYRDTENFLIYLSMSIESKLWGNDRVYGQEIERKNSGETSIDYLFDSPEDREKGKIGALEYILEDSIEFVDQSEMLVTVQMEKGNDRYITFIQDGEELTGIRLQFDESAEKEAAGALLMELAGKLFGEKYGNGNSE